VRINSGYIVYGLVIDWEATCVAKRIISGYRVEGNVTDWEEPSYSLQIYYSSEFSKVEMTGKKLVQLREFLVVVQFREVGMTVKNLL
jgi:hypothetical protein